MNTNAALNQFGVCRAFIMRLRGEINQGELLTLFIASITKVRKIRYFADNCRVQKADKFTYILYATWCVEFAGYMFVKVYLKKLVECE